MKSREIEPEAPSSEDIFAEEREFARQLLEERRKNALLPRSEDPFFLDDEVLEGYVPADLSARHDEYLAQPFEENSRSSLELLIVEALRSRIETFEDPLFGTYAVYEGPAPNDLSERHDNYLYSEEK